MKLSVILMGRHALFQRRVQGSRTHAKDAQTENEGPQAYKVQRMIQNAGTTDGVTRTTFYMAPPSGTLERDPLIPCADEKRVSVPFIRLLH